MFGRAAACAAVFFAWPVCTQISDRDGPLPPLEIVMAVDQQAGATQRSAVEAKKPTTTPQNVDLAAPTSETIPSETEPFD